MLQVECLRGDGAKPETVTRFDDAPLGDRIAANTAPHLHSCIDRAGCAIGEATDVIRVCVGQHDGGRTQFGHATEPIRAAVEHDPRFLTLHEQSAVPAVAPRSQLDFTASAEEPQADLLHRHRGKVHSAVDPAQCRPPRRALA